jgi:hypothetical protein
MLLLCNRLSLLKVYFTTFFSSAHFPEKNKKLCNTVCLCPVAVFGIFCLLSRVKKLERK